jgi:arsenate reductase (glutaredoxin)
MLKVYGYKGCDTCRKAVKWLGARGIVFEEVPIRELPPTEAELRRVLEARGGDLRALFNTSGQDYREGGWRERLPGMTMEEALEVLASQGNLVKRPVAVDEASGVAINGFREEEWARVFGK